jgi:signal transduction histidine kinase
MAPDSVATILKTAGAPTDWIGVVVDASGHIIARIVAGGLQFGKQAGDTRRAAMARAPAGTYAGRSLEGVRVETVYRALPSLVNWTVAFAIPASMLEAPVRRALYILAGVGGVGLALSALLAALVAHDLAQRRRDERALATCALAASEQRRALALDAANLGTWRWDMAPDRFDGSPRCRALLNLVPDSPGQAPQTWQQAIACGHPHDGPALQCAVRRCQQGLALQCEFRVVNTAAEVRWLRMDGRVHEGGPGELPSVQGVIADISAPRRAQAEHLALQRRLAQAQEEERRRLSRELHDQVGQTVTGLSLGLKAIEESLSDPPSHPAMRERLLWLQSLTAKIGREIHRTASDLRLAALDDFGLHRAVETFAARWSERYGVNVEFQAVGPIGRMSPDIETTVFRIIQEALTNVLKHAKARNVSVLLERADQQLRIIIEDDGVGFHPDQVTRNAAPQPIGLSGIHERLTLVGGTMGVESAPGSGATLFVQVPVQPAAPGPLA